MRDDDRDDSDQVRDNDAYLRTEYTKELKVTAAECIKVMRLHPSGVAQALDSYDGVRVYVDAANALGHKLLAQRLRRLEIMRAAAYG